jgi:ParB family chromosome partitioning protein
MSQINYIAIDKLHPHPDNPRKALGDLTELADSIKANGVMQNLTVVESPENDGYTVIIGHRRLAASKLAGLTELPCVVAEMSEKEQLSTMLVENMQRSDLTIYEQAHGFQLMLDMGDTVKGIAQKSGFSETTVRQRVKMMELDQDLLKEVSDRQISIADFDQLSKIEDIDERNKCLKDIGTYGFNQIVKTQIRRQTVKKMVPLAKKQIRASGAKAIKSSETWGGKYDPVGRATYLNEWDGESDLTPKDVKGQLYYYLDIECGHLKFYTEHKRAKPVKKSPAEIEYEKRLNAAWEQAKELTEVAYEMRSEFVEGLALNSRNMKDMLNGALSSSVLRGVAYGSANKELMGQVLELDTTNYVANQSELAMAAFENVGVKDIPKLIYANFGDNKENGYAEGYKGNWPKYRGDTRKNVQLDALYKWLCSLGYEMSDDEKALQDGTHELFQEVDHEP